MLAQTFQKGRAAAWLTAMRQPRVGGLLLLSLGFLPILLAFFGNLWQREQYQFFPLALAGAAVLMIGRVRELPRPFRPGSAWVFGPWLVSAFALIAIATFLWSPWLGAVAAFIVWGAAAWALGGGPLLRACSPAMIVLLTVIPPPLGLDEKLTLGLRTLATTWSSHLLDALRVLHTPSGNIIEISTRRLLVEEACSGIYSVLSTTAACLFFTFWRRRPLLHSLFALALTLSFVLFGNVTRITLGAWLVDRHQVDILTGWRHEALGLVLFTIYVSLILSVDQMLLFLGSPLRRNARATTNPVGVFAAPGQLPGPARSPKGESPAFPILPETAPDHPHKTSPRWVWATAAVFVVIGLLQTVHGLARFRQERQYGRIPESALMGGAEFSLPAELAGWTRITEIPIQQKVETLGVYSKIWHFQKGEIFASVALDYPFSGYHDVTLCYTSQGWTLRSKKIQPPDGDTPSVVEVGLQKEFLRYGQLWFSTVDEFGHWQDRGETRQTLAQRFGLQTDAPTTYRIQVLIASVTPLPERIRDDVRQLFERARADLARQLLTQMRPRP